MPEVGGTEIDVPCISLAAAYTRSIGQQAPISRRQIDNEGQLRLAVACKYSGTLSHPPHDRRLADEWLPML